MSTYSEEIQVGANKLLSTIKGLVREGRVRRIIVKNAGGRTVLDVPLAAGAVGAVLLPVWAAIGGLAMLASNFTVVVERETPPGPPATMH
jgi:hypothetical protein